MSNFYIKSVSAKGPGKIDSTVEFKPGLNIIKGRSNTGKTVIIKCIDFCFGSLTSPFDDSFGYTTIELHLHTEKGNISISRNLGKNRVKVITDVPGFDNGTYALTASRSQKKSLPILSDLLLASIGIENVPQIIKNKNFEAQKLTWRAFISILLFHVNAIARTTSAIEPEQSTAKTIMLSALLFLLSGKDIAKSNAQVKKEIRIARKQAVEEYVNRKIQSVSNKKEDIRKNLEVFMGIDIEQAMKDVIDSLRTTEEQISQAVNDSQEMSQQILEVQDKAAECDLLQTRYASLKTQYVSDIKRLSFIVNGEVEMRQIPQSQTCPFCEGKLPTRSRKSYVESAQAELNRILIQMNGLEETERGIFNEKEDISARLEKLQTQKSQIDNTIRKQLAPKADELKKTLADYRTYIQLQQELRIIDAFASNWVEDLRELSNEKESHAVYHPKEYFDDSFQERIDNMLKAALIDCQYENLTTVRFNMRDFDIEVNGHKKEHLNGQGYCAFLNSIVAIVFRSYMEKYAEYNPGFVVIDTPLLGLDQRAEDIVPESMRTALFNFFVKHQTDGQLIILENIRQLPDIDFEKAGANVITFTKDLEYGRYGFLNGVR